LTVELVLVPLVAFKASAGLVAFDISFPHDRFPGTAGARDAHQLVAMLIAAGIANHGQIQRHSKYSQSGIAWLLTVIVRTIIVIEVRATNMDKILKTFEIVQIAAILALLAVGAMAIVAAVQNV
jgi:hypothetical protein